MKHAVFFVYNGETYECNPAAGTYYKLAPNTLTDRQYVLVQSGHSFISWHTAPVANPNAFGRLVS